MDILRVYKDKYDFNMYYAYGRERLLERTLLKYSFLDAVIQVLGTAVLLNNTNYVIKDEGDMVYGPGQMKFPPWDRTDVPGNYGKVKPRKHSLQTKFKDRTRSSTYCRQ